MDSLPQRTVRRILREIVTLKRNPPEGVALVATAGGGDDDGPVNGHGDDESDRDHDISDVQVWIAGPEKTPYQGVWFRIKFQFPLDFPTAPPKCWFVTKIYHPNVAQPSGEICVNTLKKDWTASTSLSHVCTVIKCLLIHPNAESALNEEAGKQILEAYQDFAARAKMWCAIHAKARPNDRAVAGGEKSSAGVGESAGQRTRRGTISKGKGESAVKKEDLPAVKRDDPAIKPLQGSNSNTTSNSGSVPASPALSVISQAGAGGKDLWGSAHVTHHRSTSDEAATAAAAMAAAGQENTDPKQTGQPAVTAAAHARNSESDLPGRNPVRAKTLPVVAAVAPVSQSTALTEAVTKRVVDKKRALKRL